MKTYDDAVHLFREFRQMMLEELPVVAEPQEVKDAVAQTLDTIESLFLESRGKEWAK